MRLGIFCNFSYKHMGGSELVLKNIAELLVKNFGYKVNVYSHSCKEHFSHNNVNYISCGRENKLISQINENDHILVYSDSFWGWDTIVESIDKIHPEVSVALVGAYHMREHNISTGGLFRNKIDRFRVICHARGEDYKWCARNSIPYVIISNGVDLAEFGNNDIDFREKYRIEEKYILLNVSNYFYGKGQEALGLINSKLKEINNECRFVSISNTIDYPYGKSFLSRAKRSFNEGDRRTFLRDLPREDVIAAFKCSDVFVFPSRKEVAPLVIPECRAAGLPWISFDVGDVSTQGGGVVLSKRNSFNNGYIIIDERDIDRFVREICGILMGRWESPVGWSGFRSIFREEGKKDLKSLDWKNIVPLYNKVFSR